MQDATFVRKQKQVQDALARRYCSSKTTGALKVRKTTSSLQPISSEVVDVSPDCITHLSQAPVSLHYSEEEDIYGNQLSMHVEVNTECKELHSMCPGSLRLWHVSSIDAAVLWS